MVRAIRHKRRRGGSTYLSDLIRKMGFGKRRRGGKAPNPYAVSKITLDELDRMRDPVGPSAKVSTAGSKFWDEYDWEANPVTAFGRRRKRRGGAAPYLIV
jgi:hypothetical protein